MPRPRTVTITGGSGFVGQLLRQGLRERGYEVRVFDRSRGPLADLLTRRFLGLGGRRWLPVAHGIRRLQRLARRQLARAGLPRPSGDEILDLRGVLTSRFRGSHGVIHLAGLPHPVWPGAVDDDFRRVNHEGSVNVFEAARDAGVPKFVFASSAQVYRIHRPVRIDQLPILESNHCPSLEEGQSAYGWAKREVERYLEAQAGRGGTQSVALRLEYPGFLSRKAENFFVSTSLENLVAGFACALEAPDRFASATLNLADGEVAEGVADIQAFIRERWPHVPNHSRGNECLLSTARARELLGYRPRPGGRYLDALLA
jgi:nucleoside-diphosphate-sugar epimerase